VAARAGREQVRGFERVAKVERRRVEDGARQDFSLIEAFDIQAGDGEGFERDGCGGDQAECFLGG
jgi:hypothetical protein